MEILKNKIVDVSTPKKQKKALKALKMFNQNIGINNHNGKHITYFPHVNKWIFVSWELELNPDLIQPSELKKMLARELLKSDDVVIIEGHQPKRTRWIACIKNVEYYGDAGLKFTTTEATCLNNPSYRSGSSFAGKFKRFATTDEVAKLVEEIAINTHTKATSNHLIDTLKYRGIIAKKPIQKDQQFDFSIWRKTCHIPFQTFYPLNIVYPPLPPFIEVLKKDIQQKRVKLEELTESERSNLAVYQLGLDLVDTIKFHLSFKNISK